MKRTTMIILGIILFATAGWANHCQIEIDGETHNLPYQYAVQLSENTARLICTLEPLKEEDLGYFPNFLKAFQASGQRGFHVQLQEGRGVIVAGLSWDQYEEDMSSAGLGIQFEGEFGPQRMAGTFTTETPLSFFEGKVEWKVNAKVDLKPLVLDF